MKIDIHTHTKKCKSGDAPTRAIAPEDFCKTILATEVKIVAITNHNVFDLDQFREIESRLGEDAQVWPGVEFDILDGGSRGHLLVIVSPTKARDFSDAIADITKDSHPDAFYSTIQLVLQKFDSLGPLYIAHYKQKKPDLSEDSIDALVAGTANPSRVIKEVANSISAGIYISHGHASIYGSDIQDWTKYEEQSRDLPDLRLPVESFEHFCLLLEKDQTTINTVLNKKTAEELVLSPFDDGSTLTVRVFNDINVVFGPKGTGKTCILKAIAKKYSENGTDAKVYESASDRLDEIFDTKGRGLTINLNHYGINYCTDQIKTLRAASEMGVTSLAKYVAYFATTTSNKNAKKILLKDIAPEADGAAKRAFNDFHDAADTTETFLEFLSDNPSVKKELSEVEHTQVTNILLALLGRLTNREWSSFSEWKEVRLLNSAINKFRMEVERKTGTPAKPATTGFRDYAMNRVQIELSAIEILKCVETRIPILKEKLGSLGSDKGELECCTRFEFQTGTVTDGSLSSFTIAKKVPQKKFINCVRKIQEHAYADDLFQHVSELNGIEDIDDIKTVNELLLFKRYFAVNGEPYQPSSGEASMVMLQKELGADREVYILDEPERSLGNEYINDVIVPLIKERARANKRVFISTHDANIAVRTLPYSSIYRCHGPEGYRTFFGNPFSNKLINSSDAGEGIDWKHISMRTLEGGKEAFGERGKIYGNA